MISIIMLIVISIIGNAFYPSWHIHRWNPLLYFVPEGMLNGVSPFTYLSALITLPLGIIIMTCLVIKFMKHQDIS